MSYNIWSKELEILCASHLSWSQTAPDISLNIGRANNALKIQSTMIGAQVQYESDLGMEAFQIRIMMFHGCSIDVSQVFHRCSTDIPQLFQIFHRCSMMFYRCSTDVPMMFHRCVKNKFLIMLRYSSNAQKKIPKKIFKNFVREQFSKKFF